MCTVQYSTCAGFMKTYVHIFWDLESVTNGASQPMLANSSCGVLTWHRIDVRKETRWRRVPHTTARTVLLVPEGPGGGRRGPAARSVRMRLFVRPRAPRRCGATTRQAAGHYGEWLNWANALEQPPASLRGGLCQGPQISVRSLTSRKSAFWLRALTELRGVPAPSVPLRTPTG